MAGRWTAKEVFQLYSLASCVTQAEAAKQLNRTAYAVGLKAHKLGIVWRQGTYNTQQAADLVGCSQSTAARMANRLFHSGNMRVRRAGSGTCYYLTPEKFDRLVAVLLETRKYRQQYIEAAKAKHRKAKGESR